MIYVEALTENFYCFIMYIVSLCCVLLQRHSLFGILLSLEVVSLIMCFNFVLSFEYMQGVASFVLVFLCFEVCVMSVCLSLMVSFIKGTGSDYVSALTSSGNF
uniref:NADH-ubiquinone oxidoreductase chain 4L n=1 Tax=Lanceolaria lanceolata TaxID=2508263 RepID=A0A1W5I2M4_LANLA|nr:NADH dehydrogenase subunit 4L [Lanceolaria lanceolata]